MLGLAIYAFLAIGLGAWVPALTLGGKRSLGATVLAGYAVTLVAVFLFHVVFRIPLFPMAAIIAIAAAAGWIRGAASIFQRETLTNPVPFLLLLGAIGIVVNGGIGYVPFTIDEFTNWIGVSRNIYLFDGYEAVAGGPSYVGYIPGWQLLLLLPWLAGGTLDLGQSAAAPFVFHVGLAGLLFDIVRHETASRARMTLATATLLAWGVLLLYLAAEGTGKLWIYTLLIEQPQIYALTASLLFLFLLERSDVPKDRVLLHTGLAVMAGYLLKAAMLTFLPGLGLVLLILFFRGPAQGMGERCRDLVMDGLRLLFPVLAVVLLWRAVAPASGSCLSNPTMTFSPEALANIAHLDWRDLLSRYAAAVGHYVIAYKTPILTAAAVGALLSVFGRRRLWLVAFGSFAAVYIGILYWYHLTCFGPFYFENLNSIPRFMRVVIQPFHAVGLVALAIFVFRLLAQEIHARLLSRKPVYVLGFAGCLLLMGWQAVQIHRSVQDVTTRRFQSVDSRIGDVRAAAAFVRDSAQYAKAVPLVQFISQGTDADILGFAKFYAIDGTRGKPRQLFRYGDQISWNPAARTNIWQKVASKDQLRAKFLEADIVWPIVVDPFVSDVLKDIVPAGCASDFTTQIFVKSENGGFTCVPKRPHAK